MVESQGQWAGLLSNSEKYSDDSWLLWGAKRQGMLGIGWPV